MRTYAEAIQKPGARIHQERCPLPVEHCVEYIGASIRHLDFREHKVYASDGTAVVDKRYRDSIAIVPRHDEELAYFVFEAVQGYFQANFQARPEDSLVLAQTEYFAYGPGEGLKMHSDDHAVGRDGKLLKLDEQRGITAILYLNSDFEGGEICFPRQDTTIKPSAGLLLVFPSNRNFPHEVKPIRSGRRLSYQRIYGVMGGEAASFVHSMETIRA